MLSRLLTVLSVMLTAAGIYYAGPWNWLAHQNPWEWARLASILLILGVLLAILRVRKSTVLFTIAWFAGGLAATGGCGWLCWYTWTHPADRNWYAIPIIGALAIFAVFVFWFPLLSSFSKSTRLVNRVETAVLNADPNADRYLQEAREVVGTGNNLEQSYLDLHEGKLRSAQGRLADAVPLLERAITHALQNDSLPLACDAGCALVRALVILSRDEEAANLADALEERWGKIPELREALQVRR